MISGRGGRWIWIVAGAMTLAVAAPAASAEAASCGDTAGPGNSRVPCACEDTVITTTRLQGLDPIVTTPCVALGGTALNIGADDITLDCQGQTLRGGDEQGLFGRWGILGRQRNGVTVRNCSVEFFVDGIVLEGHRNRLSDNRAFMTLGGILVAGDQNRLSANRADSCLAEGVAVLAGRGNQLLNNHAVHCFDGFVVDGEQAWIAGNVAFANGRMGFLVEGSGNTLVGNAALDNGEDDELGMGHGFGVSGLGNVLVGNAARDSEGKGFCVVEGNTGSRNVARGNSVSPEVDFNCEFGPALAARAE